MTKDDLISRQAAIEAIERNAYRHTYLDQIINIISNLPSAEVTLCHLDSPCEYQNADIAMPSAQQWIPVSERLPEGGKYVLAYSADDDYMTVEAKHKFEAFQITHWMPLPKPWKGEEDNEDIPEGSL